MAAVAPDVQPPPPADMAQWAAALLPALARLRITEQDHQITDQSWINALIALGFAHVKLAADSTRTVSVLVLPTRVTAGCWVALGGLLYSVRFSAQQNVWKALANSPRGTVAELLVRNPRRKSGWDQLRVELLSVGPDRDFAGERAVCVRVVDGPKQYRDSTLKWSWRTWRNEVYPPPTRARAVSNASERSADRVITALADAMTGQWIFSNRQAVTLVTDVASIKREVENITLATSERSSASLLSIIAPANGTVRPHPIRTGQPPPVSPLLVLDGPKALRQLEAGGLGSVVVLLEFSEVDASVENLLGPWLAAHDAVLDLGPLAAVPIPRSWQLVVSRFAAVV
jgi:hypothetical protein